MLEVSSMNSGEARPVATLPPSGAKLGIISRTRSGDSSDLRDPANRRARASDHPVTGQGMALRVEVAPKTHGLCVNFAVAEMEGRRAVRVASLNRAIRHRTIGPRRRENEGGYDVLPAPGAGILRKP